MSEYGFFVGDVGRLVGRLVAACSPCVAKGDVWYGLRGTRRHTRLSTNYCRTLPFVSSVSYFQGGQWGCVG